MGRRKIIDMGASLHKYKPKKDIYADIETYLFKGMQETAPITPTQAAALSARRAGKSMVMGMAYGGRLKENLQQTLTGRFSAEAHPLRYLGGYKHLPRDPRLAGAHLYKTNNQNMSGIISKGMLVPHTTLNYHLLSTLKPTGSVPALEAEPTVAVIAWCRRHTLCELTDAIATLQMMGHDSIAVVRAFEP